MEIIRFLAEIMALLALTILCVYLIIIIVRIRYFIGFLEKDLKELSGKAIPVLTNLETITDKVQRITENIDDQVEVVKSSIASVKEIADDIVHFERRVQARIEEPVMESIGAIAAVAKGIRAFFARLRS